MADGGIGPKFQFLAALDLYAVVTVHTNELLERFTTDSVTPMRGPLSAPPPDQRILTPVAEPPFSPPPAAHSPAFIHVRPEQPHTPMDADHEIPSLDRRPSGNEGRGHDGRVGRP